MHHTISVPISTLFKNELPKPPARSMMDVSFPIVLMHTEQEIWRTNPALV